MIVWSGIGSIIPVRWYICIFDLLLDSLVRRWGSYLRSIALLRVGREGLASCLERIFACQGFKPQPNPRSCVGDVSISRSDSRIVWSSPCTSPHRSWLAKRAESWSNSWAQWIFSLVSHVIFYSSVSQITNPLIGHEWLRWSKKISSNLNCLSCVWYYLSILENLDRILSSDYVPSADDILHIRIATVGMDEHIMRVGRMVWRVCDPTGIKGQRSRWLWVSEPD